MGLTDDQLLRIRDGRNPKDLAPEEQALCDDVFEVTAGWRVPQRVAEAMHQHVTPRQIVDIALLTSFSSSVAALALALGRADGAAGDAAVQAGLAAAEIGLITGRRPACSPAPMDAR